MKKDKEKMDDVDFVWDPGQGAMAAGLWTLLYALLNMGLFAWQSYEMYNLANENERIRGPVYGSYGYQGGPADLTNDRVDSQQQSLATSNVRHVTISTNPFYTAQLFISGALLVSAVLVLIGTFLLLVAVVKQKKALAVPHLIFTAISTLVGLVYCIHWWSTIVRSYWWVLTGLEFVFCCVNVFAMMFVVAWLWSESDGSVGDEGAEGKKRTTQLRRNDYSMEPLGNIPYPYPQQLQYTRT